VLTRRNLRLVSFLSPFGTIVCRSDPVELALGELEFVYIDSGLGLWSWRHAGEAGVEFDQATNHDQKCALSIIKTEVACGAPLCVQDIFRLE
jgi:hypothetical protein